MSVIENQTKKLEAEMEKTINTQNFLLKNVMDAFDSKPKENNVEMKN